MGELTNIYIQQKLVKVTFLCWLVIGQQKKKQEIFLNSDRKFLSVSEVKILSLN